MKQIKTTSNNYEDEFVYRLLTENKPEFKGTFLDIGCGHGRHGSNTYTLEEAGWTGWMIDTTTELETINRSIRKCTQLYVENYNINWEEIIPSTVDYISFNDPSAMKIFPWNIIRFRVLTFNHKNNTSIRDEMRKLMLENKYMLLVSDVCNDYSYKSVADWFVDSSTFDKNQLDKYKNISVRGIEVIYKPKSEGKYISYSADLQDEFVARILGDEGRFLDVGCGHGFDGNNTLTLEKIGWNGEMIDFNNDDCEWNKIHRSATVFCEDVTICDWNVIVGKKPDEVIRYDYISFDVDDATIPAVEHFPWSTIRFRLMTIEHDAYRVGGDTRQIIRDIMEKHGYMLLAADICADFNYEPYEDWFVDPKTVDSALYMPYLSKNLRAAEVVYSPR
jgi:SAM-dependent methyltransferase